MPVLLEHVHVTANLGEGLGEGMRNEFRGWNRETKSQDSILVDVIFVGKFLSFPLSTA